MLSQDFKSVHTFYVPHLCMPSIAQVLLSHICDPVHNEYQQRPSSYFNFLHWWKGHPCKLKEKIDDGEYPPCIHMDVRYDDPAVRPEVVTTLKICTLFDRANYLHLTMKVPSEFPFVFVFGYLEARIQWNLYIMWTPSE